MLVNRVHLRGSSQETRDDVDVPSRHRDVQRRASLVVLRLHVRVHLVDEELDRGDVTVLRRHVDRSRPGWDSLAPRADALDPPQPPRPVVAVVVELERIVVRPSGFGPVVGRSRAHERALLQPPGKPGVDGVHAHALHVSPRGGEVQRRRAVHAGPRVGVRAVLRVQRLHHLETPVAARVVEHRLPRRVRRLEHLLRRPSRLPRVVQRAPDHRKLPVRREVVHRRGGVELYDRRRARLALAHVPRGEPLFV